MELRQLRYFVSIIELGSFTKAAEKLRIAQPALGFQIRKLEDELEVQLLIRHSRGVEPTEAGRLLFQHANDILERMAEAKQTLKDFQGPVRGKVVLGMTPSTNLMISTNLVRGCAAEMPHISLAIIEELSGVLVEWVRQDRLDMALAYIASPNKDLIFEPLLMEDLFFVAPASSQQDDGPISFTDVLKLPLILPGLPHGLRQIVEDRAAGARATLDVKFEMQSVHAVQDMVAQGVGYTILPYGGLRQSLAAGSIVARRIVDPPITRQLALCRSGRRPLSQAENAVRQLILSIVKAEIAHPKGFWRAPGL